MIDNGGQRSERDRVDISQLFHRKGREKGDDGIQTIVHVEVNKCTNFYFRSVTVIVY